MIIEYTYSGQKKIKQDLKRAQEVINEELDKREEEDLLKTMQLSLKDNLKEAFSQQVADLIVDDFNPDDAQIAAFLEREDEFKAAGITLNQLLKQNQRQDESWGAGGGMSLDVQITPIGSLSNQDNGSDNPNHNFKDTFS